MSEPVWNDFLTERDRQVFAAAGYATKQGFGKRPAILVVDVNYNFCGERPEPILESIKRWRNSCGAEAWEGVKAIKKLIGAARAKGLPIVYSTGTQREDNWDRGAWAWKSSRTGEKPKTAGTNLDGNTIVIDIAPQAQDIVIEKLKPSVFHGTPLQSYLVLLGADSVIVTGTTTSGCVRATVVDAFSNNYRVSVVEEACFDRSQASHAINLCDMNAKYADIAKLDETLKYIETLPHGLFDLPKGTAPSSLRAVG